MDKIKSMLVDYINDTTAEFGTPYAELQTRNGVEGVLFLSPDSEPDEWYPLEDMGYNSEMGFFQCSLFPGEPDEARPAPTSD